MRCDKHIAFQEREYLREQKVVILWLEDFTNAADIVIIRSKGAAIRKLLGFTVAQLPVSVPVLYDRNYFLQAFVHYNLVRSEAAYPFQDKKLSILHM